MYSGTFDGSVYPIARGGFWPGTYCWTRSRGTDNFYSITNPSGEANEMPQTLRGIIVGFCI